VPFVFLAACLFAAALLILAVRRPGQAREGARPGDVTHSGDAAATRAA